MAFLIFSPITLLMLREIKILCSILKYLIWYIILAR